MMNISIQKKTAYKCVYKIKREDNSHEDIELEIKIYLLHDLCHFVIEKKLELQNGFWGLLNQGYRFDQLFGKENTLTEELRNIEKLVGPIQAIYIGNFRKADFQLYTSHLDISVSPEQLQECLDEIGVLHENWKHLSIGEQLSLSW